MTSMLQDEIERLEFEIAKAEAWKMIGEFTSYEKTFLSNQMLKHKKQLKDMKIELARKN